MSCMRQCLLKGFVLETMMRRLLVSVLALCMILLAAAPVFTQQVYGVRAEKRIVKLPEDQGKWYVSVVGDDKDPQYQTILKWFDETPNLRAFKKQVHFCPVGSKTVIYQDRYATNVKGLPTVRLQDGKGLVVYEAAGKGLPLSAEGLYGALASSVLNVQRIVVLPWRRNHACPTPGPQPEPEPILEPEPIPDSPEIPIGPPVIEPIAPQFEWPPFWLMLPVFVVAAAAGMAVEWVATYARK